MDRIEKMSDSAQSPERVPSDELERVVRTSFDIYTNDVESSGGVTDCCSTFATEQIKQPRSSRHLLLVPFLPIGELLDGREQLRCVERLVVRIAIHR